MMACRSCGTILPAFIDFKYGPSAWGTVCPCGCESFRRFTDEEARLLDRWLQEAAPEKAEELVNAHLIAETARRREFAS